jgi:isocitrate dehydrogenase kinase/phosphatase
MRATRLPDAARRVRSRSALTLPSGRRPPVDPVPDPRRIAERVIDGYLEYRRLFSAVTQRAAPRFESREWIDAQEDARERILLYDVVIHETLRSIRQIFGDGPLAPEQGARARSAFGEWARERPDPEVAETFFNSVIRRLFGTVGVDPDVEFVAGWVDDPPPDGGPPWTDVSLADGFAPAIARILDTLPFKAPWHEREERVQRASALLRLELGPEDAWSGAVVQVLATPFFRNKAAYAIGRLVRDGELSPLVLALTHPPTGIQLDAVLPTSDEVSVVFGFTRSYLHADIGAPRATIDFLRSIMPLKRVDELYTAIGFNRHGKTELYRTLVRQLEDPEARFEPTPGQPGLVMSVFTIPELNVVFKVIRDRFGHPKNTTRERVMRNYRLIFVHDRVGRLADAQQFERLELPADRFSHQVLTELLDSASRTVSRSGDTVTIEHLYTERRVHPLDLYLEEVDPDEALRVTLDFGQAIKDLAAANIFPGDMLVKNFGVTRHGRVIFYDYDEVAPLTECNFRERPRAAYPEAEFDDEPSYFVGPDDVFPAEWRAFLGPPGPLRHELQRAHPELFEPQWWRSMQEHQRAGEIVDFFPYPPERRLEP